MKRRERLFTCTDGKEKLAARRLLEVMLDIELDRPEDEMDTEFIEQCLDALLKKDLSLMDSSEPHLPAPCRSSMKQAR